MKQKFRTWWFSINIFIIDNIFCSVTLYLLLYNDIWYHVSYLKSILAQLFHNLLFYMNSDTVNIFIISGIAKVQNNSV